MYIKVMPNPFLCVSMEDVRERGLSEVDFIFVSGDAYVDHASFAAALLGRLLESHGYTVGILAQPDWHTAESFKEFGRPKLAFLVSAGAMDSMVSNYISITFCSKNVSSHFRKSHAIINSFRTVKS